MKRLIKKSEEDYKDDYLGKYVEIVYTRSKFFGYRGWVEDRMRTNDKYRIFLEIYNGDEMKYHIMYVSKYKAYQWLKILDNSESEES